MFPPKLSASLPFWFDPTFRSYEKIRDIIIDWSITNNS